MSSATFFVQTTDKGDVIYHTKDPEMVIIPIDINSIQKQLYIDATETRRYVSPRTNKAYVVYQLQDENRVLDEQKIFGALKQAGNWYDFTHVFKKE